MPLTAKPCPGTRASLPRPSAPSRPAPVSPVHEAPDPLRNLLRRRVSARLLFGDEITGLLVEVAKFEVVIRTEDAREVVILKGALATCEAIPETAAR